MTKSSGDWLLMLVLVTLIAGFCYDVARAACASCQCTVAYELSLQPGTDVTCWQWGNDDFNAYTGHNTIDCFAGNLSPGPMKQQRKCTCEIGGCPSVGYGYRDAFGPNQCTTQGPVRLYRCVVPPGD